MPKIVPQHLKSLKTINLQPEKMNSKIQIIILMDIAGSTNKQISHSTGLCESRVSIIKNSPMYMQERENRWQDLSNQFVDKRSDKLSSGDPVENKIKDMALIAAQKYGELLDAKSEFVQKTVADAILDRAGYRAHTEKTKVTVEVTEKMADRFERVLGYEHSKDARKATIKVTQEVSK